MFTVETFNKYENNIQYFTTIVFDAFCFVLAGNRSIERKGL